MKKVIWLIACIIFLTSCSSNKAMENSEGYARIVSLDSHSNSAVLYYDESKIYFYEITSENEQSGAVLELYEYDLQREKVKTAGKINDFFMCTNSVVRIDGGIAFSVCTQTEDELKNNVYVYQKDELQNIYSCSTNIPMSFISKITDNELAFFCPDSAIEEGDEYYIYQILKIDIEEGSSAKIKEFNYNISEQSGEIISTIDSHDGLVYIFKKSAEKQDNIYSICVLDSDGNLREEYSVDISNFLYLELTSTYDSIYKMKCLEENLIALQTINNRILILDIENNKIRFISAPDVLSAFPEGYKIAGYSDDVKQDIYFVNMYNDKLIRLDVGSKEFFECNIQSDLDEMHVSALNINSEGNILIKTAESFYISKNNKYSVCPESIFL